MKGDALAQPYMPGNLVRAFDPLGQVGLGIELAVKLGQPAIEHIMADIVGRQRALGRIERVGGRAGQAGRADASTPARLTGGQRAIGQQQPGTQAKARAHQATAGEGRQNVGQWITSCHLYHSPTSGRNQGLPKWPGTLGQSRSAQGFASGSPLITRAICCPIWVAICTPWPL